MCNRKPDAISKFHNYSIPNSPISFSLLSRFFVFAAKIEAERWVLARPRNLDGDFGLTVLAKEGIEGLEQK